MFDGLRVGASRETGITCAILVLSRPPPDSKEMNKNETFVFLLFFTFRYQDQPYLTGERLRRDVQYWLSPLDPPTDHEFVCEAHYTGTARWFFESEALVERKRTRFCGSVENAICWYVSARLTLMIDQFHSRFREKYTSVCGTMHSCVDFGINSITVKFRNYSGYRGDACGWTGHLL